MPKKDRPRFRRPDFWWGILTLAMLVAAGVCAIVDVAVTGGLTWAWIVLGALALTWCVISPLLLPFRHRLLASLSALTLLIMPFLLIVQRFSPNPGWVWPVAFPICVVSLVLTWAALALFRYTRISRWYCAAIVLLGALAINPVVDASLYRYAGIVNPVNVVNYIVIPAIAAALAVLGTLLRRRRA